MRLVEFRLFKLPLWLDKFIFGNMITSEGRDSVCGHLIKGISRFFLWNNFLSKIKDETKLRTIIAVFELDSWFPKYFVSLYFLTKHDQTLPSFPVLFS